MHKSEQLEQMSHYMAELVQGRGEQRLSGCSSGAFPLRNYEKETSEGIGLGQERHD